MRTFGFTVNNELFEQHSWYFRNALVRANYKDNTKGIYATNKFLLPFFENLLFGENHILRNREMHVHYDELVNKSSEKKSVSSEKKEKSSEKIVRLIKSNTQITIKELAEHLSLSTRAIEKNIAKLKYAGIIERIGADKGGHWKVIEK